MSSHSGVDRQEIWEVKELCPASQSGSLIPRNGRVVNPEGVADTDYDRRMLQHRREDREGEHLLITDQDCRALVIDRENSGSVETKRDADSGERPPHSDRNRHALV